MPLTIGDAFSPIERSSSTSGLIAKTENYFLRSELLAYVALLRRHNEYAVLGERAPPKLVRWDLNEEPGRINVSALPSLNI